MIHPKKNKLAGAVKTEYYIQSDRPVAVRFLEHVNKVTDLMTESGLHEFYKSYAFLKEKYMQRAFMNQTEDDDMQALTVEQIKRPLFLVFCLFGIATTVFIAELVIVKWKNRQHASNI